MILTLLLAIASPEDSDALMRAAANRLAATCDAPACAARPANARYRIGGGDRDDAPTSKDRAIRDDGSRCNVVGARRCPKRGRTIFRTDFTD